MSQSIQLFFTIFLSQFCQANKLLEERNQTIFAVTYENILRKELITKKSKFVETDKGLDDGKPAKEFKRRQKIPNSFRYKGSKHAAYYRNRYDQAVNNVTKDLKNHESYNPENATKSHVSKNYRLNYNDNEFSLKINIKRGDVTQDINNNSARLSGVQKRDLFFKLIQLDSESYEESVDTNKIDDVQRNELYYFSRDDAIDDIDIDFIEPPKPELSVSNIILKDKIKEVRDHNMRFPKGYWSRSKVQSPSTVITYIKNFSLRPKIYHRVSLAPNVTLKNNTSRMISLLNKNHKGKNRFALTKIEEKNTYIQHNDMKLNTLNLKRKDNKLEGSIPVITDLDLDADKNHNMKNVPKIDGVDIEANDLYSEEIYFADDKNRRKNSEQISELLIYKENCGYENNLYKSTESLRDCLKKGSYVNKDNILSIDYENPHRYPSTTDYNINDNNNTTRTIHSTPQIDFNTNKDSGQINYNVLKNLSAVSEEPNTERFNNDNNINSTLKSNAANKDDIKETDDKDSSMRSHINQEGNITLRSDNSVEKKENHSSKGVSEKEMIFLTTQGITTETYMVAKPVAIILTNNVFIEKTATVKSEGLFPSHTVASTFDVPTILRKCSVSTQTYREPSNARPARSRRDHFNNIWSCFHCGLNATGFGTTLCHAIFENDFDKRFYTRRRFQRTCTGDPRYHGQCFKRYLDIGTQYNERGCRDWPPIRGSSFASNSLTTLEYLLKDVANGCVASPQAMLVRFSRSMRLYARFHVCVCSGQLCNVAEHCQVDFLVGSLVLWVFLFR